MVRTRTKKLRGGHYGRGMKAGRGKGKRGGSGMSGLGKHRWVWLLKYDRDHFGGHGFTSHHQGRPDIPITLSQLEASMDSLRAQGFVKEGKGGLMVDLAAAGYTKLLGSGDFRTKATIKVGKATEKALSKLSSQGITVETDGGRSEE
jgi:LSU ribosomal protein L15P